MPRDRRRSERIPVSFYAQQVVDEEPHRCFTTSLSSSGLYLERVASPLDRRSETVQLEVPLPGTGDSLWARAEVVYDCVDPLFHGTAFRFTAMARGHRRLLRDWVRDQASGTLGRRRIVRAAQGIEIFRPSPRAGQRHRARLSAFGLPTG